MARRIVSSRMRRQWTEQVDRGEKTEEDIAKEAGFRIRTVRAHVSRGRDELAFDEAKAAAFRSALQDHYRDLGGLADHLNRALDIPPKRIIPQGLTLPPLRGKFPRISELSGSALYGYPHADKLIVALAQHIPRSQLWSSLRKWDQLVDAFNDNYEKLKAKVKEEVRRAGLNDAGGAEVAVAQHVDSRASGGAGLLPLTPWKIKNGIAYGGGLRHSIPARRSRGGGAAGDP